MPIVSNAFPAAQPFIAALIASSPSPALAASDDLGFLGGKRRRRSLHRIDGLERHDHGAVAVGVDQVAALAPPCRGRSR